MRGSSSGLVAVCSAGISLDKLLLQDDHLGLRLLRLPLDLNLPPQPGSGQGLLLDLLQEDGELCFFILLVREGQLVNEKGLEHLPDPSISVTPAGAILLFSEVFLVAEPLLELPIPGVPGIQDGGVSNDVSQILALETSPNGLV